MSPGTQLFRVSLPLRTHAKVPTACAGLAFAVRGTDPEGNAVHEYVRLGAKAESRPALPWTDEGQ